MKPFDRFSHPTLALVATTGLAWWLVGLLLGVIGPTFLGSLATLTHLLGLVTLIACGVVYVVLWWAGYTETKLAG